MKYKGQEDFLDKATREARRRTGRQGLWVKAAQAEGIHPQVQNGSVQGVGGGRGRGGVLARKEDRDQIMQSLESQVRGLRHPPGGSGEPYRILKKDED